MKNNTISDQKLRILHLLEILNLEVNTTKGLAALEVLFDAIKELEDLYENKETEVKQHE